MLVDEVLPALPELTLDVAGDGSWRRLVARHAARLNRRAGREVVRLRGYQANLAACLAEADAVLGVGRVAVEALNAGVPVLSVNGEFLGGLIGVAEYATAAHHNFVARTGPAPTAAGLVAALRPLVADPARWRREAAQLRGQVAADFGLAGVVARTALVYEAARNGTADLTA